MHFDRIILLEVIKDILGMEKGGLKLALRGLSSFDKEKQVTMRRFTVFVQLIRSWSK